MLDLVIRGGDVVDGTGAPRRRADIGVVGDRIVSVGTINERATKTIDASGMIVAPGFIDVHTHLDVQGFWDSTLSPSPLHGVTTAIGGNCGFSVAPLDDASARYLMTMLARVEGMPLQSLELGVPWNWKSTEEFLDVLDGTLSINTAFMVGHSALRRVVMGPDATVRAATDTEVEAMAALLRAGLQAGALGFSSTWATTHNDADGRPVPSRFASAAELITLAAVCKEFPGTSLEFLPSIPTAKFERDVIDVMVEMSVAAQRPLNWNVIIVDAATEQRALSQLAVADEARQRGGKVVGLVMPISAPARICFYSGFVLDAIAGWESAMALPPDEKLALLHDPEQRAELFEMSQRPGPMRFFSRWDQKVVIETHTPETKRYEGRLVADIAEEERKSPFDALLDIVCTDGLLTSFTNVVPVPTPEDWAARVRIMRDHRTVVGASDAGAHLDMASFFTYSTRLLAEAVREQQVLPLEEAIHLITDAQAQLYGLRDRGRLQPGSYADVVIFDEARVGAGPVAMRFDLPGGSGRLYAEAHGIENVVVNGVEIVRGGTFTDARPGTILRSGRDTDTPALI